MDLCSLIVRLAGGLLLHVRHLFPFVQNHDLSTCSYWPHSLPYKLQEFLLFSEHGALKNNVITGVAAQGANDCLEQLGIGKVVANLLPFLCIKIMTLDLLLRTRAKVLI
jgi:hypothetical protein